MCKSGRQQCMSTSRECHRKSLPFSEKQLTEERRDDSIQGYTPRSKLEPCDSVQWLITPCNVRPSDSIHVQISTSKLQPAIWLGTKTNSPSWLQPLTQQMTRKNSHVHSKCHVLLQGERVRKSPLCLWNHERKEKKGDGEARPGVMPRVSKNKHLTRSFTRG